MIARIVLWIVIFLDTKGTLQKAYGLPYGFGYNQGNVVFSEKKTPHFYVYYDARVPHEGALALESLERASPILERWFDLQKRSSPLIINMSAISKNASFANFITDSIELQPYGGGIRDLTWHEYTHATMYRHLDNWFGPAGSVLHLIWMPAWYLEGLAEAVSISLGSDLQAGIERYDALTGRWPSYDRLHSLYGNGPFAMEGYSISGSFMTYLLRTYGAQKLPSQLKDFYRYSMPWWWPWAAVPWNGFMPMDTSLDNWTKKSGKELYAAYQKAALQHWQRKFSRNLIVTSPQPRLSVRNHYVYHSTTEGVKYLRKNSQGEYGLIPLEFAGGFPKEPKGNITEEKLTDETLASSAVFTNKNLRAYVINSLIDTRGNYRATIQVRFQNGNKQSISTSAQEVSDIFVVQKNLFWMERSFEKTQLCFVPLGKGRSKKECPLSRTVPFSLEMLGIKRQKGMADPEEIWFLERQETSSRDGARVLAVDLKNITSTGKEFPVREVTYSHGGIPRSIAFTGNSIWMLISERGDRIIRKVDNQGQCLGVVKPSGDLNIRLLSGERLISVLYNGGNYDLYEWPLQDLQNLHACHPSSNPSSPLLYALRHGPNMSFAEALKGSSTWQPKNSVPLELKKSTREDDEALQTAQNADTQPEASWRARPVLLFPWIGAEDALGPQFGVVSVPLMDHLQNETIKATFLYGPASRYPYTELALLSSRYRPTWTLAVFRSQTFNGLTYEEVQEGEKKEATVSYLDEKGLRLEGAFSQKWTNHFSVLYTFGGKVSHLSPYLGSYEVRQGRLVEPYSGINFQEAVTDSLSFSQNFQLRWAPKYVNEEFDYDVFGTSLDFAYHIGNHQFTGGVEASRTRGPKRRELQEVYRYLKTFVPGSGGGYNKNSFAMVGGGGLFSSVYSDTQGKLKLNYTVPLVPSIEKLVWIIYMDRLDFSAFFNYGGGWPGSVRNLQKEDLLFAHGYNVDLQMDNKGVRFQIGLGTGQVWRKPWQVYLTTGFDALF